MRTKKALVNTITSLMLQLTTIICGFIIPSLVIKTYGSGVNGLITSITQFLGFIVLLESGIGGVVRAALYKPLANKDIGTISAIIKATEKIYKSIVFIFIVYLLIMTLFFPLIIEEFEGGFTASLVIIIGASTLAQYSFGITYQLLLQADQKRYVTSLFQIFTIIINTIMVVILIKIGTSIHIVRLVSTIVFIIRPIILSKYVKRNYSFDNSILPNKNAIKQRWDGLGHHIAYFLYNQTDVILLTLVTNVKEVSVYSVYSMIVVGIKNIISAFSSGVEAAFGNMLAKDEKEHLKHSFSTYELFSTTLTTIFFTGTALLILPFVDVYTKGVEDVEYYRPLFAYILVAASAVYSIRLPYHYITLAAGHFKQTRNGAFLEAGINLIMSAILVNFLGIIGVAIGTFCSALFRTVQYAIYTSKNILDRSVWIFCKSFCLSIISSLLIIYITHMVPQISVTSYVDWCLYGSIILIICIIVTSLINFIFFYNESIVIVNRLKNMMKINKLFKKT